MPRGKRAAKLDAERDGRRVVKRGTRGFSFTLEEDTALLEGFLKIYRGSGPSYRGFRGYMPLIKEYVDRKLDSQNVERPIRPWLSFDGRMRKMLAGLVKGSKSVGADRKMLRRRAALLGEVRKIRKERSSMLKTEALVFREKYALDLKNDAEHSDYEEDEDPVEDGDNPPEERPACDEGMVLRSKTRHKLSFVPEETPVENSDVENEENEDNGAYEERGDIADTEATLSDEGVHERRRDIDAAVGGENDGRRHHGVAAGLRSRSNENVFEYPAGHQPGSNEGRATVAGNESRQVKEMVSEFKEMRECWTEIFKACQGSFRECQQTLRASQEKDEQERKHVMQVEVARWEALEKEREWLEKERQWMEREREREREMMREKDRIIMTLLKRTMEGDKQSIW